MAATSFSEVWYRIRSATDRSRRYSQRHFRIFGAFAVVLVPLSTVVEQAVGRVEFETVYVRLLAGAAGLPILLYDRLPKSFAAHLDLIWIIAATFILPFCFGTILTLNAAYTDEGSTPDQIWVYQYLVSLFIFIQLVNHGPLSVGLWVVTSLLTLLFTALIHNPNTDALLQAWLYPLPVYLTALLIGSITNRNVHMVQSEQLRAASAIGSNIAHELRTPLASIRMLAHGVERFLPTLVDAYTKASDANITLEPINDNQLRELRRSLRSVQEEVQYSNTIIDILLINTSETTVSESERERFRVSSALNEAIARFPFNNSDERRLLECSTKDDFLVFAPRLLVVHVIFNLIKNGLFFVQKKSGKGTLSLNAFSQAGKNWVEITDTGVGIPAKIQPRIFDRFFSTVRSGQSAGIGLTFCQTVMHSIGGEIHCDSREGEYTTFRLVFPPVSE